MTWKLLLDKNHTCAYTLLLGPYRNNEPPLLEVFDERNGVLFEVGQAAVDGLGVIVWPPLLLGSFVQPLLQVEVGAGQEHHQVRSADLPGNRTCETWQSNPHRLDCLRLPKRPWGSSDTAAEWEARESGQNVKTAIHTRIKITFSVRCQ